MAAPLSPTQAAQAVGISRWSIVRAIKADHLRAVRDNHGNWCIAPDDLAAWRTARRAQGAETPAQGARTSSKEQAAPPLAPWAVSQSEAWRAEVEELRVGLAVAAARAEAAQARATAAEARIAGVEVDRDAWRAMAERQQALLEDHRQAKEAGERPRPKSLLQRLLGR